MPLVTIAYFISSHGFGHAARAAAVMQAIADLDPKVHFEIFTEVPAWFFRDSLAVSHRHHQLLTDFGLAQITPFYVDLEATLQKLNRFYPIAQSRLDAIVDTLRRLNCTLVICDIAPMGILAARGAGIPSVLIENFTWDWIYEQYATQDERIRRHIDYLRPVFHSADFHIQTEPLCLPGKPDLVTVPVSRRPRSTENQIRQRLGLRMDENVILITTGGIPQSYDFLKSLKKRSDVTFVMPGAGPDLMIEDNLVVLPHHSEFYHPDLVGACDAVIGKVGYSTLAEVYHAGIPFGYVARSEFNESGPMVAYIEKHMPGLEVSESEFGDGTWIDSLGKLLGLPRRQRIGENGAEQIGKFILAL